jgi:hypothetical protein
MKRHLVVPFILFAGCAWLAIYYALEHDTAGWTGWGVAALLTFDSLWSKR